MYYVTVPLSTSTNLYHASKVVAGLTALEHAGEARVTWTTARPDALHPVVLQMDVAEPAHSAAQRIALDLLDRGDVFDDRALAECDVYFKRSFSPDGAAALPKAERQKLRPLGLNHRCQASCAPGRLAWLALRFYGPRAVAAGRQGPTALRSLLADVRQLLAAPRERDWEAAPEEPLEPLVVYQTRLWEPHDTYPDDAEAVNAQRVEIVRALQAALGPQFLGGLAPTRLARERYPELCVPGGATHARRYARDSRRARIGVYTRGLHDSLAFKLGEYLAGAKAIVAEGIRHVLPEPLVAGQHFVPFITADQCVAACQRLLSDESACQRLRAAAADYYRREVSPAAWMRNVFQRALQSAKGALSAAATASNPSREPILAATAP